MPNYRKRKNGIWEGRQYINGKSFSAYSKNLKTCKQKLKEKISNITSNSLNKNLLVSEWFLTWAEVYKQKNLKIKTFNSLLGLIKNHINKLFRNISLQNLTGDIIQKKLTELKPSRTTNLICTYLNAGLEKALQLGYIKRNPYKSTEIKKHKVGKGKAFTYQEQVKIVNEVIGSDIKDLFFIYVLTGIRKNEIYNIISFDYEKEQIKVIREKSDNKIKTIFVKKEVISIIENLQLTKTSSDVFYKKFKKILKRLNVTGTVHSLRHTYATNNYYLGTPIKHLQQFMGHEDIALTYNIYTDFDEELTKEKIVKLYNNLYYTF
ncbi:MAG: tyrosine-type recombinase/integrase [Clostridia bacterium]|nr:tyrosine-type recombinase/integrase [Clostridia bacterium]